MNSDPSFLLAKKEPEVKPKKVTKATKVATAVVATTVVQSSQPEVSVKAYASKKIKNEIDVVIRQIEKLSDKITQHNEILAEQKVKLEELKSKKVHLEQLKESI